MKIVTSYFYKIRFFSPNMIPLSTAVWDPKWFHQGRGQDFTYLDKRGVINGLRCGMFMPGPTCNNLCHGSDGCPQTPDSCSFLKAYRAQLDEMNIDEVIRTLEIVVKKLQTTYKFDGEPIMALIVHEAPSKPCSERVVIQRWFVDNNHPIKEWGID